MNEKQVVGDPIEAIALLDEPHRRHLYDYVASRGEAVGRDDAASAVGVTRELAAFHLDRLVEAGLLGTEYRRLNGRAGPGAGRPAKLYRRANRHVAVSLPPRHYEIAADIMATALDRPDETDARAAVTVIARERGAGVAAKARQAAGARPGKGGPLTELAEVLRGADFEPQIETSSETMVLRNCPYDALVAEHRDLTCGMNLAWAEGVLDELGAQVSAELAPEPGRCCVVFRSIPVEHAERSAPGQDKSRR